MAYTTIDDPSKHFQSIRWTGNGAGQRDLTFGGNSDLQPDATMWFRENGVQMRLLTDSSRSWQSGNKEIIWNASNVEGDTNAVNTGAYGWLAGHTSVTDGIRAYIGGYANSSNINYYAANWKLNGSTVASNTNGNITSSVQVNSTTKQSIITYTGNGTANQTIGHGLGYTPAWWFVKNRTTSGTSPLVGSTSFFGGLSKYMQLDSYEPPGTITNIWGEAAPTGDVISVGNHATTNANGASYVMYVFSDVQGFHKHGKYTGTGNADGPTIYTGFKPRVILTKRSDGAAGSWVWHDSRMGQSTGSGTSTGTDINAATANQVMESSSNSMDDYGDIDFLSNGFKIRDTDTRVNLNNASYVYFAWADSPFVTSKGVPATAR
jgi:hypothetical protein